MKALFEIRNSNNWREWWDALILWMETSTIPLFVIIIVAIGWMLFRFWWDIQVFAEFTRKGDDEQPPQD